jgi:hypothetical protein
MCVVNRQSESESEAKRSCHQLRGSDSHPSVPPFEILVHRVPHSNYTTTLSSHPAVINVMHRVLLIDEVMVQILTNLGRSSEVATMARVCRAFNELASDVIWKEIDSILPLIMCMPIDLVKKTYTKAGILRVVSSICECPLLKASPQRSSML